MEVIKYKLNITTDVIHGRTEQITEIFVGNLKYDSSFCFNNKGGAFFSTRMRTSDIDSEYVEISDKILDKIYNNLKELCKIKNKINEYEKEIKIQTDKIF